MVSTDTQVAVIGGGVVGCAVAHALARRGVQALLLEAERGLALGASGANSGILHTGFDATPGELETRLILRSAALRDELLHELGVSVWRCGAQLAPSGPEERAAVARLAHNARANRVEVDLHDDGSLSVAGEAVTDPVAFVHALARGAQVGGASIRLGARVDRLAPAAGGELTLELAGGEQLRVCAAVNCAGLHADEIAHMAGEEIVSVYPRKGEFLVFGASHEQPLERILLPVPSAVGKGVLVFPTLDRRAVIAGPTAREREDKRDWSVEADAAELILPGATRMYPALQGLAPIGAYAGLRPAGRNAQLRDPALAHALRLDPRRRDPLNRAVGRAGDRRARRRHARRGGCDLARPHACSVAVGVRFRARGERVVGARRAPQPHLGHAMSSGLLLGIDEGTTAVKAALFDCELRAVAESRRAVPIAHPQPGWVEQDPELILHAIVDAVAEVLERANGREVLAAGLDHQGESVLAWDADTTRALTPVIVWQDKRQQSLLAEIHAPDVERSGLPLDPYFSAGKLAWLLANDAAVQSARDRGALRLGTVDAFLTDRLGGRFATDLSTASRTQLLALGGTRLGRSAAGGVRPATRVAARPRPHVWPARGAATRPLGGGAAAGRAARRPASRARRHRRGPPGRAEGDLRDRRVRARAHLRADARERPAADRRVGRAGPAGRRRGLLRARRGCVRRGLAAGLAGRGARPRARRPRARSGGGHRARQLRRDDAAGARRSWRTLVASGRAWRDRGAASGGQRGARWTRCAGGDRVARSGHRRGDRRSSLPSTACAWTAA